MREVPDMVAHPQSSTIRFDAMEFGYADATFDDVAMNFGDGEGFSWLAGGGKEYFKILRASRGHAIDDGTPCSAWIIEVLDSEDTLERSYVFDCPKLLIREHSGESVQPEQVNKTMEILLDVLDEQRALRAQQPFRVNKHNILVRDYFYQDPNDSK